MSWWWLQDHSNSGNNNNHSTIVKTKYFPTVKWIYISDAYNSVMFVLDFTTPAHLTFIVGLHLLNLSIALHVKQTWTIGPWYNIKLLMQLNYFNMCISAQVSWTPWHMLWVRSVFTTLFRHRRHLRTWATQPPHITSNSRQSNRFNLQYLSGNSNFWSKGPGNSNKKNNR